MLTRPGDWNQVLSTSFYLWTCGDKRLCRQRDTPDYQLKCQLVWCTVPLHWMCHYMCDTCVPRSISPGQKRRYRPQTVKIHDLQDYYDEMISVFKIIPLTKIQFCLNHCFFFFLLWPANRRAPITCICHHYYVTHIAIILLRRYLDQFTAHYVRFNMSVTVLSATNLGNIKRKMCR